MTLGLIPHKYSTRYGDIRDRVKVDGSHWLQPELLSFFNTKLEDSNETHSKIWLLKNFYLRRYLKAIRNRIHKWL